RWSMNSTTNKHEWTRIFSASCLFVFIRGSCFCFILFLLHSTFSFAKQSGSKEVDYESELPAGAHHLKIGDAAPDFSLKGVDGKIYTLADFKTVPVLMVIFLSDHCPYSHAIETRLLPLVAEMKPRGLGVVAIMPN